MESKSHFLNTSSYLNENEPLLVQGSEKNDHFVRKLVWESISEGFKVVGQKLSKILVHLYFVGRLFFLPFFDLLNQCASFSKNFFFEMTFGFIYHVIMPI